MNPATPATPAMSGDDIRRADALANRERKLNNKQVSRVEVVAYIGNFVTSGAMRQDITNLYPAHRTPASIADAVVKVIGSLKLNDLWADHANGVATIWNFAVAPPSTPVTPATPATPATAKNDQ